MKRVPIMVILLALSMSLFSQGNKPAVISEKSSSKSQKEKNKNKDKQNKNEVKENEAGAAKQRTHQDIIWEGTSDKGGSGPKLSKNIPDKVRRAFQRDYPLAVNVTWYKYRGDWTPSFFQGLFTSTAVYHANGQRVDTRTPIPRTQLPIKIEDILKKRPSTRLEDIIRIEIPASTDIYRLKTITDGVLKFMFYNGEGAEVPYNY